MTVLARIVEETRSEIQWRKRKLPLTALEAKLATGHSPEGHDESPAAHPGVRPQPGAFQRALAQPGIGVIAEFKRRSPSAGSLHDDPDLARIVDAYERGGASALSVLTEGPNFGGTLDDLRAARAACVLPILRKDFIVDSYQLYEALDAGADAVLLIVAALTQQELASLHEQAHALGLDVLVEVHDGEELKRAASVGARLIGVNNRDLRDFSVDVQRTSRLLGDMPEDASVISESGIAGAEQLRALERQGVAAVLVGEALMRAEDPARALAELLSGSSAPSSAGAPGPSPASSSNLL